MCLETTKSSSSPHDDEDISRLEVVASKQEEWSSLPVDLKIKLIQELIDSLIENYGNMDDFIQELGHGEALIAGFREGSDGSKMTAAFKCASFAIILHTFLKKYLLAYKVYAGQVKKNKVPTFKSYKHPLTGKTILQTLPGLSMDKYTHYANATCELWLQNDNTPKIFDVGSFLQSKPSGAKLVLAAGNHNFLTAIDVLYSLFHDNQVVYVKHHPLRGDTFHGVFQKIFQPFIHRGYMDSELDSGMERNQFLCHSHPHNIISSIHMTGGKTTHDAIVWGNNNHSSSTTRVKPSTKKLIGNDVKMTSELGCVSPWIIMSDPNHLYDATVLKHQAKTFVASKEDNSGHNCNSPQILIFMDGWSQRDEFLQHLKNEMMDMPLLPSYYPGCKERRNEFIKVYGKDQLEEYGIIHDEKENKRRGVDTSKLLPLLFHPDLKVDLSTEEGRQKAKTEYAFRNEFFGLGLFCVTVPNLETAVDLCNNYLFGTLSMNIITPEKKLIEKALVDLKYGCIAVNGWSGMAYAATGSCWGAYPGETLDNVESGIGHVGNLLFLPTKSIEKTVLYMKLMDPAMQPTRGENLVPNLELYTDRVMRAVGNFSLQPGVGTFVKLMFAIVPALEQAVIYGGSAIVAALVGMATWRYYNI